MTDVRPGADRVGEQISDPWLRANWRSLAESAAQASAPGGPLEGWLFHGCAVGEAEEIAACGMRLSPTFLREGGQQVWVEGTYWGDAWLATFYAEDRVAELDAGVAPSLLAVPLAALIQAGALAQDEQSLDTPIESRLGRSAEDADRVYVASVARGEPPWRASLAAVGALVCLGTPTASAMRVLSRPADIAALVKEAAPASSRLPK